MLSAALFQAEAARVEAALRELGDAIHARVAGEGEPRWFQVTAPPPTVDDFREAVAGQPFVEVGEWLGIRFVSTPRRSGKSPIESALELLEPLSGLEPAIAFGAIVEEGRRLDREILGELRRA
jgi:hypothetical protein